MNKKRNCSKSKECKIKTCIHYKEHFETEFCNDKCDTFLEAICIITG
jgi:hypothetical protein